MPLYFAFSRRAPVSSLVRSATGPERDEASLLIASSLSNVSNAYLCERSCIISSDVTALYGDIARVARDSMRVVPPTSALHNAFNYAPSMTRSIILRPSYLPYFRAYDPR